MAKVNKGDRKIILADCWPNNLLIEMIDKHHYTYGIKQYTRWCRYEREQQQVFAAFFENNVMSILNDITSTSGNGISEQDLSMVLCHFRDGMTIPQIAETYHITPNWVRCRLHVMISKLRDNKYLRMVVEGISMDDSKHIEHDKRQDFLWCCLNTHRSWICSWIGSPNNIYPSSGTFGYNNGGPLTRWFGKPVSCSDRYYPGAHVYEPSYESFRSMASCYPHYLIELFEDDCSVGNMSYFIMFRRLCAGLGLFEKLGPYDDYNGKPYYRAVANMLYREIYGYYEGPDRF